MNHGVTFEAVFVAVVEHISVESFRIDAQVAHCHRLEHQAESVQVVFQVFWPHAKGRRCHGRVNEISCFGGADGRFGAQVGAPRGHVFHDEDFLQCRDV